MSKRIEIKVSQETVDYIQGISFEVSSRQSLLATLATVNGVTSASFKEYQKEYFAFDAEYQLIKDRLQEIYIPAELRQHELTWNLDFQRGVLIVDVTSLSGVKLVESGVLDFTPKFENDDIVATFNKEEETACSSGCACSK
jgi:hypothetical protein